jgi:hypothetical protein
VTDQDLAEVAARRLAIMQAECPRCGAGPGERCRGADNRPVSASKLPHFARREAAVAAGLYTP